MKKLIAVLATAAATAALTGLTVTPASSEEPPASPPNVIVVVSDDQVKGTEDAMPVLRNEIIAEGLTFTNGITPTALCCPSRASLLTGKQSHTTGVYTIDNNSNGGWKAFHDKGGESDTLSTHLDAAGYNTGLFGKYLNGFQSASPANYTAPGWDTFNVMKPDDKTIDGTYYNYSITGLPGHYGTSAADYSTDVFGELATDFVANTPNDQPFFVMYTPFGPHSPATPAPRHKNAWPVQDTAQIPAFNEGDMSDKSPWLAAKPKVPAAGQATNLRKQHTSVMSVDEQLQNILDAAGDRLDNTIIVYMADNGLMLGSHRLTKKDVPYRMATEVPMYVRWDSQIAPNTTTSRVTPQIDLTALIRDAVGISDWQMEGRNPLTTERDGVALEQVKRKDHPAYCGWRTATSMYVKYSGTAGQEFYDYVNDPEELANVAADPSYAQDVQDSRSKAVANCFPVPPGFKW